jgi:hypothetical protein
MVVLMNIYNKLREMDERELVIKDLQLLLSMSTLIRNRESKISRANNGKAINDWDCFNRVQDKICFFLLYPSIPPSALPSHPRTIRRFCRTSFSLLPSPSRYVL